MAPRWDKTRKLGVDAPFHWTIQGPPREINL